VGIRPDRRCRHERRDRPGQLGQVVDGEHRDRPRARERRAPVDGEDARVGMRAPNDREMQKLGGREVVEVAARADEEARVFLALDGHADRHARVAPRCASRFA